MQQATNGKRWTLDYPELGTGPLPITPYLSADHFALEREKIFTRTWLATGRRAEELPKTGDYLVLDVEVAKTSILLVRGKDGRLRGFHNVCKHRGNRLAWAERGSCRAGLSCKFHGWTYAPDGRLSGVPEEDMFFDFDRRNYGLTPVATDVWEGFIFINLNPRPTESLAEYLGEVTGLLQGYPFDRLSAGWSYTAQQKCNWRILRDSQLEFYHGKSLHQRWAASTMINKQQPSCHVLDAKLFRRHAMVSFYGDRRSRPRTPMESLMARFWTSLKTLPGVADMQRWPTGVNPTRSTQWFFDIYYVFPNFHIVVLSPLLYVTHTIWPVAPSRSIWNAQGYFPPPATAAESVTLEYNKCLARDVWLEDGSTLEHTQRGIESGVLTHYPVQDQELMIRHAHKVAEDYIAG